MTETSHDSQEQRAAAIDPVGWINRQSYGELKRWLKSAVSLRGTYPIIVPPSTMPATYLAHLLLQADARVKNDLRSIIPEVLSEWTSHDSRESLKDMLVLCSKLNCNEAETVIARLVVYELGDGDEDAPYRSEALGALQDIGTERTLNIFLRYIDDPRHAATCYRGLYRLNPVYAATELPALVRLYRRRAALEELKYVVKVLFKYTLKPREYITVLRPFAEQAEPESFVEVLELLISANVFNAEFFAGLSQSNSTALFGQLLKRARVEDCEKIARLLAGAGMVVEPPPEDAIPSLDLTAPPAEPLAPEAERFYYLVPAAATPGAQERWKVASTAELGYEKGWRLKRSAPPDKVVDYIYGEFDLPSPPVPGHSWIH